MLSRTLFSAAMLLVVGGTSALAIALITAGHIASIPAALGAEIAAMVVWQTLAVTIGKMGLDAYLLPAAAHLKHDELHALPKHYLYRAAFIAGIVSYSSFALGNLSWQASLTVAATTLIDIPAIIRIAELTGQGRLRAVIIGNLLRLPLFFVLIVLASVSLASIETSTAMLVYVTSAAIRLVWILLQIKGRPATAVIRVSITATMGQQVANFIMFRGDQMIASAYFLAPEQLAQFFFLTKFSEMISMAASTAGGTLFPAAAARWARATPQRVICESVVALVAILLVCMAALAIYKSAWKANDLSWMVLVCVLIAAVLAWPVNYLSYALLRRGHIRQLIIATISAILAGTAIIIISVFFADSQLENFLCALPSALFIFLATCLYVDRKGR